MAQADDFTDAIGVALDEAAKKHTKPELNAVLGALSVCTGQSLALVPTGQLRKQLYRKVCSAIKEAMNKGTDRPNAELVPVESEEQ